MKKIKSRIGKRLAIIVFLVFTVFLYGPYSIFLPNVEDMWFTLSILTNIVLPISAAVFGFLFLLCIAIPDEKHHIFTKLLFGLSLALYIQGNFINISYADGVQDGTEIIWSSYTWYAIIDTLAWILCLAVPFIIDIIVKKNNKTFRKAIIIASLFLTVIQVPAFVSQAISFSPNKNTDLRITTDNMFEISDSENILVFMLDSLDGAYYNEFIDSHPEYKKNLTGFVNYENTLAAGGRTIVGVPAMLTGTPFTRQETYSDYLENVWDNPNVLSTFNNAGYEVSVYSSSSVFSTKAIDYVDNFEYGGGKVGSTTILAKKIYKMDFYKFFPHILKPRFWYTTSELSEAKEVGDSYVMNDVKFYDKFTKNGFTVDSSKDKVFQLYHLNGAHAPYTVNEYGKKGESSREKQVAGNFYRIAQILDDLKAKGLYDNATIIITADHGDAANSASYMTFLLKESGATGEYTTNSAPVSGFDLVPYLSSLVGKELSDLPYSINLKKLEENTVRERHYFFSTNADSKLLVQEFVTNKHATDGLTLLKTHDDSWSRNIPVKIGEELTFKSDATANRYTIDGFGQNTGGRTKLRGPYAKMEIPLAKIPQNDELYVYIKPYHKLPTNVTTIKVSANGAPAFEGKIDKDLISSGIVFPVSTDSFKNDKNLILELYFPEIDNNQMNSVVTKRTETISLVSMRVDDQAPEES